MANGFSTPHEPGCRFVGGPGGWRCASLMSALIHCLAAGRRPTFSLPHSGMVKTIRLLLFIVRTTMMAPLSSWSRIRKFRLAALRSKLTWNNIIATLLQCLLDAGRKYVDMPVAYTNKKLRCRDEHSASVVLSWCTLWYFSGENPLMANQPLLRNCPPMLPNSAI